jgi:KTSC domain
LEHEKQAFRHRSLGRTGRTLRENTEAATEGCIPEPPLESSPHNERGSQHMKRITVSSEGILEVGFHQDTDTIGTLELLFSNGGVYEFFNVPSDIYDEFMHAPSREDYYFKNIGKRFPCTRVG